MEYILGIETSCDDTGVAICKIENDKIILQDELLSSQVDVHKEYGGVVPEVASRLHLKNLPILFSEIIKRNNFNKNDFSAIGVTQGPGLKGSLLMGVNFAKGLAFSLGKPLIGVHHIKAHIMASLMDNEDLSFPFLAIVVSGGHTELVDVKSLNDMTVLSRTMDDAAGEAFDKSANLLGFEYPGGAMLSKLADTVNESEFSLPKVMREAQGFSFSGLKTAISLLVKKNEAVLNDENTKARLCFAIQDAIVDAILYKTKKVLKTFKYKNIVLAGGVAANKYLRHKLSSIQNTKLYCPSFSHCQDNGAMTAYTASMMYKEKLFIRNDAKVFPRWDI